MTELNYMITLSATIYCGAFKCFSADGSRVRRRRARDIDPCGPGRIKNNEIPRLCQVEMSAES